MYHQMRIMADKMNTIFGGINHVLSDYYEQRTTNNEPIYSKRTQFNPRAPRDERRNMQNKANSTSERQATKK